MKFPDRLRLVANAERKWAPLPRVDIAIFDTHCGEHLARIFQAYSIFSIDVRGESFHVPTLIAACWQYVLCQRKASIWLFYFSKLISKLGAKICITNQDSSHIFYELDKQLPEVRFIATQQGLKDEYAMEFFSNISGDYFAFGKVIANALANPAVNMHVCGSIKANMARLSTKKHRRICFISGLSVIEPGLKVLRNITYAEFIFPAFYASLREVDNFCRQRGIELIITSKARRAVMSEERHPVFRREWNTYGNILGRPPPLVMADSYELAGDSELVVCDHSALGYEMLGRGCKVVFINLVDYYHREKSYRFGWPMDLPGQGPFWTNLYDPGHIQNVLDRVWNMSAEEWKELIVPFQEQLMCYDPGNSILLKHVRSILDADARSGSEVEPQIS